MAIATTKMSSKGQVVIPEKIRQLLNPKEGSRFVVIQEGDTMLFKVIPQPSPEEFMKVLTDFRKQVKKAGVTKADVTRAIKEVRSRRLK